MSTKRTNFQDDDTETQTEEKEIKSAEDQEKDDAIAESRAELEAEREARRKAEIDAARSAGEADALKRNITAPQPTALSEDQWQEAERDLGMTRDEIVKNGKLIQKLVPNLVAPITRELEETKKRADAAEKRAQKLESRGSVYETERAFYEKHPELTSHRSIVNDFVKEFGNDDITADPGKYEKLLEKARVYARGVVKESRTTRTDARRTADDREPRGSQRLSSDREEQGEDDTELDLRGIKNDGSRRLLQAIHSRPGVGKVLDHRRKGTEERYKSSLSDDGMGVEIDETREFSRGQALMNKDLGIEE